MRAQKHAEEMKRSEHMFLVCVSPQACMNMSSDGVYDVATKVKTSSHRPRSSEPHLTAQKHRHSMLNFGSVLHDGVEDA